MDTDVVIEITKRLLATPSNRFRWRIRSNSNGKIIGNGGQGFANEAHAVAIAQKLLSGDLSSRVEYL